MESFKSHILVIDDDEGIRSLLKQFLNENGYLVNTASNALEAKEKISMIKFDLLVLDIMMPGKSGLEFISENKNVAFVSFAALIVVLKFSYDTMLGVGVYTQYMPEQPIAFSHKVHAGENGVDCNYCHSSARKSKHSGIPSANVCMNCHTYINEGKITGTTEISKIYDAVGFDPDSKTYIEGYEQKSEHFCHVLHNQPIHSHDKREST